MLHIKGKQLLNLLSAKKTNSIAYRYLQLKRKYSKLKSGSLNYVNELLRSLEKIHTIM